MIRSILVASSVLVALAFAAGCTGSNGVEGTGGTVSNDKTTSSLSTFCNGYAKAKSSCGVTVQEAACEDDYDRYSDSLLDKAQKCLSKACSDVDACVNDAFGTTDSAPTPKSDAGPTAPPAPPPPPPAAPVCKLDTSYTTTSCNTCMSKSCCEKSNACTNNADCGSFLSCFSSCSTDSCRQYCASYYPNGVDPAVDLASCMSDSCDSACN